MIAPATASTELDRLAAYLSVQQDALRSCLDAVTHTEVIDGIGCSTLMYHLKYNGNGQPKFSELADCMYQHVINYCLNARDRPTKDMSEQEAAIYTRQARRLFIRKAGTATDPDATGQAGEMLLYMLIEAILGAPQVVAKMDLKTNSQLEINGSDGIHMAWNESDQVVDIFFGESKIYQSVSNAITNALASVDTFHVSGLKEHEFGMVTSHFKYTDEPVRKALDAILNRQTSDVNVRINHACLIGYNWPTVGNVAQGNPTVMGAAFQREYLADASRIHSMLRRNLEGFARKELILKVFFLPFRCVQEFREAFYEAVG